MDDGVVDVGAETHEKGPVDAQFFVQQLDRLPGGVLPENHASGGAGDEAHDREDTTIRANRDMMRHVISNLVSNAVRHGDTRSVIKITCNQRELAIENACKPLTKQQLQHVFDPFCRSNSDKKQHTDNSGIGLYTVKILLDTKGLDYSFAPHGQGMRFVVRFT